MLSRVPAVKASFVCPSQKRTLTNTSILDDGRLRRVFAERRWKECHLKRIWRAVVQENARTIDDLAGIATLPKAVVAGLSDPEYQVYTTTVCGALALGGGGGLCRVGVWKRTCSISRPLRASVSC